MDEVEILIEGYVREVDAGWETSSSTVLVKSNGKYVIVDPGINRPLLLSQLEKRSLKTSDINSVFLTHYHLDHAFLAAVFENATVFDEDIIYRNDFEKPYKGYIPETNLQVLLTPGHADKHATLLVKTSEGNIVIAGDTFWWMDGDDQVTDDYDELVNCLAPFAKDKEELIKSRKQILEVADFIIPGHGKMFKNLFKK